MLDNLLKTLLPPSSGQTGAADRPDANSPAFQGTLMACGGGPELNVGDIADRASLDSGIKTLNDFNNQPLQQLVISSPSHDREPFRPFDEGKIKLDDGSTVSVADIAEQALVDGTINKQSTVAVAAKVKGESDPAYGAMQDAAKEAGVTIATRSETGASTFSSRTGRWRRRTISRSSPPRASGAVAAAASFLGRAR